MNRNLHSAVELLRAGDPAALERALALIQGTVYSFSMKVCGHREDAEDTSQDVLVRALPYLPQFDSPQALSVWLYKVARNRCLLARRRGKFEPDPARKLSLDELMPDGRELEELLAAAQPSAEASLVAGESAERLRTAILSLPPPYRLVLVLHDMEELSSAEVARILELREATVRVRLHRARLYLRRELARPQPPRRPDPGNSPRRPRCRGLFAALSDYLDGLVDDATCDQMQRHLHDCRPCQAFLTSLRRTVEQCRSYTPECGPDRSAALREQLVRQYARALEALRRTPSPKPARIGSASR